MIEKLDILRMAQGLAAYSADRQAVVARNVANADTPGYRAQDLQSFNEIYQADTVNVPMRQTRETHLAGLQDGPGTAMMIDAGGQTSPNGNSVSLETEMVRAVEVKRGHDMALAVYKTSLDLLRTSLGRGR